MDWLDVRPGIDPDMNFGTYYYDHSRGSTIGRNSGVQKMALVSRLLVLAAVAFSFVGIVAVVLLLPALY